MGLEGLGMPLCCFPRIFLNSRSTLVEREGWKSLWSCVRCTELASVSSVPSWTGDSGVALWRRTPATCYVSVGSPSSTLHARRGVEEGEFSGAFFLSSQLPLPHLCTLSEVVGRVSRLSAAPVRVLPGLPILGYGSQESVWDRSWSIGSRVRSCCSLSLRFPCEVSSRDAVYGSSCLLVDLVRSLCDSWLSTDCSRFRSVRSSGFGVAGGGFFWALAAPLMPRWHGRGHSLQPF